MTRTTKPKVKAIFATEPSTHFFECDNCIENANVCVIGVKTRQEAVEVLVTKHHWERDSEGWLLCPKCAKEV